MHVAIVSGSNVMGKCVWWQCAREIVSGINVHEDIVSGINVHGDICGEIIHMGNFLQKSPHFVYT